MYSYSLWSATSSSGGTRLIRFALGRFGGTRGGGGAVAAPGCVIPSRGRSASSTSAASSGMEQPKQPQQQDAVSGEKNTRDGTNKAHWDPITHSFGEGYSTRADEEGFGMVYVRDHDEEPPGHPEYDTSQGHEVREKEKGRHFKDDKHAN